MSTSRRLSILIPLADDICSTFRDHGGFGAYVGFFGLRAGELSGAKAGCGNFRRYMLCLMESHRPAHILLGAVHIFESKGLSGQSDCDVRATRDRGAPGSARYIAKTDKT